MYRCNVVVFLARRETSYEHDAFIEHYAKLCAITDVDNLLPYFVQRKIITFDDQEEISGLRMQKQKARKLLTYISGPLEAGNIKVFNIMLKILEECGNLNTQTLAEIIKKNLAEIRSSCKLCS